MKIVSIEAIPWDVPMRAPYRSAQRVTTTARNVLVTVTLEDGTRGYGESAPATYVTGETQESVVTALTAEIPALAGGDIEGELRERMERRLSDSPGAKGALETALSDAAARAAGLPLYRWFGADENTPTERVTDLSLPILTPEEAIVRATEAAQQGFRSLKIKVGCGDLAADEARVRAIAQGSQYATLRLDGNQGFTPEETVRFLEALSDLAPRIELVEQPTKAGDDAAMRFVSERIAPIPVYADESIHGAQDARRLLESGICRGVVLKMAKSGIRGVGEIVQSARETGAACMFGCMMETHIAVGAALHLAVYYGSELVPFLDLDGHLLTNDISVLTGGFTHQGDVLRVDPTVPGLGVTPLPVSSAE